MKINVKGMHINVGEALTQHCEEQLTHLISKYFEHPIETNVVFSKKAHLHNCHIMVHANKGINIQSSADDVDIYTAFNLALDKLSSMLRKYKTKLRDNHHRPHKEEMLSAIQYVLEETSFSEDGPDQSQEDQPMIIAEIETPIETLSVSEAVMRMDLGEHTAYMFRNSSHGDLNMVYRRLDGNVGWVDPKVREKAVKN